MGTHLSSSTSAGLPHPLPFTVGRHQPGWQDRAQERSTANGQNTKMCLNAEQPGMEESDSKRTEEHRGGLQKSCHLHQVLFPPKTQGGEATPKIRSDLAAGLTCLPPQRTQCTGRKITKITTALSTKTHSIFVWPSTWFLELQQLQIMTNDNTRIESLDKHVVLLQISTTQHGWQKCQNKNLEIILGTTYIFIMFQSMIESDNQVTAQTQSCLWDVIIYNK